MLSLFIKTISFKRVCSAFMVGVFLISSLFNSYAQSLPIIQDSIITLNQPFHPPVLKGVKVDINKPLSLEFILDKGDFESSSDELKQESIRLIKYFLASVTIPEEDLWVNLSPYEEDRIVPDAFGVTEMGRDLLVQDYLLKQVTAALFNPDSEIGKPFWKAVYQKIQDQFGTIDVPIDVFNKVWIVPQKAIVYENTSNLTAYVLDSKLSVMTEMDYLAMTNNLSTSGGPIVGESLMRRGASRSAPISMDDPQSIAQEVLREIIIPILEKEVNEGQSFAQLRQIYQSLVLATWYKKRVTKGALYEAYANQNKVSGVNISRPQEIKEIWEQYVQSFKQGAFNFIKQDVDPLSEGMVVRKYFSGGVVFAKEVSEKMSLTQDLNIGLPLTSGEPIRINTDLSVTQINDDEAMSDILVEEFKFRFPKSHELMLAMFGELLLTDNVLKDFFYRLVSDEKHPMTEQRAQYIASLLRIEKQELGEDQGYPFYFQVALNGETSQRKMQYTDLDQDFINWAVKMNLPLNEFPLAYGFYVERKEEERIRQGSQTVSRIRAGNKMGQDVFRRVVKQRTSYQQPSLMFFRQNLLSIQGLRWIDELNLSKSQVDDITSLGVDIKDFRIAISPQEVWSKDSFEIYLFTRNKTFIDKTSEVIKESLPPSVPLVYAQIQILNGIPTITAFQPRFRLPHSVDHHVKEYIENSMKTFGYLLESNVEAIIQSPSEYLRFLTPSFFMMGLKTKESTLQHYYFSIPRDLGYVIKNLSNPIRGLFRPIHFVFEKKLKDDSATISKDHVRFLSSKDLEEFLRGENKKDSAIARRILANRIILLAMRKAQRNQQTHILNGLKKAHDGLTIGRDVDDVFSTQAWAQYLKTYRFETFQMVLIPDETGLSQEFFLTNDETLALNLLDLPIEENKTASVDQQIADQEKDSSQKIPNVLLAVGRVEYQQGQYIVKHQQRKQPFKTWMSLARSILHIYDREFEKLSQESLSNGDRINASSIIKHIQEGLAENVSQILSMRISEIYRRLSVMRSAIKENKPNIFIDSANGLNQLSWSKEPELEGVYTQMRVALRIVRDRGIQQETIPFILKALDEAEKRLKLNEGLKRLFYSYQKEYVIQRDSTKNLSYEKARDIAFELTINKEDLLTEPDQTPRLLLLFYQLIFVSAREHPEFFKKISSYIHHRPLREQEAVVKNDAERLDHLKPSSVPVPEIILDAWDMFSPSISKNELSAEKNFQEGGIDLMIKDETFAIQYESSQEELWASDGIISQPLKGITGLMPMRVDLQHISTAEITTFLSVADPL